MFSEEGDDDWKVSGEMVVFQKVSSILWNGSLAGTAAVFLSCPVRNLRTGLQ